jgi:hypothetical protein
MSSEILAVWILSSSHNAVNNYRCGEAATWCDPFACTPRECRENESICNEKELSLMKLYYFEICVTYEIGVKIDAKW